MEWIEDLDKKTKKKKHFARYHLHRFFLKSVTDDLN